MRINDRFSIKNPTHDFENQMVDLRTPSCWDKFKTWQKPYQALFLSILTLVVVGIVIGLCLYFLGSEVKREPVTAAPFIGVTYSEGKYVSIFSYELLPAVS